MSKRNKRDSLANIRLSLEGLCVVYGSLAKEKAESGDLERSAFYAGKQEGMGEAIKRLRGQA